DTADVKALGNPDPETELRYVMDAVRLIQRSLDNRIPLIGFSGSPWTLATYMVEGRSTKTFSRIKGMLYNEPLLLHRMLKTIARSVTAYLNAQIAAGVQVVMIFDTWGGVLTPPDYAEFSLQYMQVIINGLTRESGGQRVPVILFTKGGCQWLEAMADTGADALGIDWSTDLAMARKRVGGRVALQGNLDPTVLYAAPDIIREKVAAVLAQFGTGSGHVFNLGHGINPDINPDHAAAMIKAVHELSKPYHE
ncbi:MAG: uroporphyrinogen decarboxylase family protein, partial [Pseudomonadota bacterium]|nr:uroporphyrinogen decarboxylase family protein [Pseudomonadota bacterium]